MNEQSSSWIPVSQKYKMLIPVEEDAYMIPISDWNNLHEKIKRIDSTTGLLFHTIGSVLLGVAGSALVGALTSQNQIPCWAIFAVSLISGLLSLYFASQQRKLDIYSKDDILKEIHRIERRYRTDSQSSNVQNGIHDSH
ncbi:hypothetical protein HYR99_09320 [Candidatus Poribacteria bacterium]|nr:hypothetical protein [Candidatus Poribacteria bacterium]